MNYLNAVTHCAYCGTKYEDPIDHEMYMCRNCGKPFFIAVVVGAAGILINKDKKILLITRARNPNKGTLDVPAGFVDWFADNSFEDALKREVKEEIGISNLKNIKYHGSYKTIYSYAEIEKTDIAAYFIAEVDEEISDNKEEVAEYAWYSIEDIPMDKIGFDCTRKALEDYKAQL